MLLTGAGLTYTSCIYRNKQELSHTKFQVLEMKTVNTSMYYGPQIFKFRQNLDFLSILFIILNYNVGTSTASKNISILSLTGLVEGHFRPADGSFLSPPLRSLWYQLIPKLLLHTKCIRGAHVCEVMVSVIQTVLTRMRSGSGRVY
jgi:hypothetical protein